MPAAVIARLQSREYGSQTSQREYPDLERIAVRDEFRKNTKPPVELAQLIGISERGEFGVYSLVESTGLERFWRVEGSSRQQLLLEINRFKQMVESQSRDPLYFEYTSLNGEKMGAHVVLPNDYVPGRRYPMVVKVYPGNTEKPRRTDGTASPKTWTLPEWPAFGGYILLSPTVTVNLLGMSEDRTKRVWPIGAEEGSSLFEMPNGVLPAVQRAIDMGISDPERVVLMGASWGGWATLCLITQTTRFKAAIAEASAGQGVQFWPGLFRNPDDRYSDSPGFTVAAANVFNQNRISDVPWWRDSRADRNNPMLYADRVRTPLLLVHGDLDGVSWDTSQDFFNALVTMRKPAQFLRYWGAGHGPSATPANNRDYTARMLAWSDRWCDVLRDEKGDMVWDGDRVKTRNGAPPLEPEEYFRFPPFGPGGENGNRQWVK